MRRSLVEAKRIPNITPIVKPINNRKEVAPLFGNIKYSTFVRKDKTKKKKKRINRSSISNYTIKMI